MRTELGRYEKEGLGSFVTTFKSLIYPIWWVCTKSPKEGAQTTIYCAVEDNISSGSYYR